MGYLVDAETGQLRPVAGIAGAAVVGTPVRVLSGQSFRSFWTSREAGVGIGISAPDSRLVVVDLTAGHAQNVEAIADAMDSAAISANGRFAVAFGSGRMILISGLPAQPEIAREIDLTGISGALSALAVADDGRRVLFATADGLFQSAGDEAPRLMVATAGIRAAHFLASGAAVFLNAAAGTVFQLQQSGDPVLLADGLSGAIDLADAGSAGLLIALPDAAALLNVETREIQRTVCDCEVSVLQPLAGNTAFRLTGFNGNAARLLDLSRGEPRMLLLPPPARDENTTAGGAQ